MNRKNDYDDIINLSRPKSKRPRMAMTDRAAQFSPFAALTGHGEAVKETARLTDERLELVKSAVKKDADKAIIAKIGRLIMNDIQKNI